MKILLIEDNDGKRDRIKEFLLRSGKVTTVEERRSYNSGIRALMADRFDLVLLDMSLPTYDKTEREPGGSMRVFGGMDILSQMKRRTIKCPVVVVTQFDFFDTFDGSGKKLSLAAVKEELEREYKGNFWGLVSYNASKGDWENDLANLLATISRKKGGEC